MLTAIIRGARVIDPQSAVDAVLDVWVEGGVIRAIDRRIEADGVPVLDLTRDAGNELVLAPGFTDLHAHLREPGGEQAETVLSGAAAAAAGGFTQVVAMANTPETIDNPDAVRAAVARNGAAPVRVLQVAAMTRGLAGRELADIAGCVAAGAVAVSDDGRNAFDADTLATALQQAADVDRAVWVHPEDEDLISLYNAPGLSPAQCPVRPVAAEASAVSVAVHALTEAGRGRLHLQHLSSEVSLDLLRRARDAGLAVTAEVTPHHLALTEALTVSPRSLGKVNPPLRTDADRAALAEALRSGLVDAVATDHAPHPVAAKGDDYVQASPGMVGLETALGILLGPAGLDVVTVVRSLTTGPAAVLAAVPGARQARLAAGRPADLVILDPAAEWVPLATRLQSRSSNTPLLGQTLRGRVLLTVAGGVAVHRHPDFPFPAAEEAARA